jgi:hypothetical protein
MALPEIKRTARAGKFSKRSDSRFARAHHSVPGGESKAILRGVRDKVRTGDLLRVKHHR